MVEAENLLLQHPHDIVLKISSKNPDDLKRLREMGVEVAIDFSSPDVVLDNIKVCLEQGIPLVEGTTGWHGQREEVRTWCEQWKGHLVYASNFSLGVQLFFALNRHLAGLMKDFPEYKIRIQETHHTDKKDRPSGTAISLAEQILAERSDLKQWLPEQEGSGILPVYSGREPGVTGTHQVSYRSGTDEISLQHEAFRRNGFAQGALLAAARIVRRPGFFDFSEILHG